MVQWLGQRSPGSPIGLIGFSLGANLVLKLASEAGAEPLRGLDCVLAANPPIDLAACALRLTNTIGPRMRIKDARQTFLGIWVKLLLQNTPFEVWGGEQLRDFTYVDDVVEALLLAARKPEAVGQIFNLGGNPIVSLKELAELLVEANGAGTFTLRTFPEDRKRIDIGDFYADAGLIRQTLGWAPTVSLRDGLARTLDFYRAHKEHYL